MTSNEWMNDPSIRNISYDKLDFLQKLAFESGNLDPKQKMPFFMALANRAKQEKISFTQDEMERIIRVLKKNATPGEVAKMDQILNVYRQKSS